VSVFRPSARAVDPQGKEWEIYASKLKRHLPPAPRRLRRLVDRVVVLVRALRSDEWVIKAVSRLPGRETYVWLTTTEFRGQVLAQIEGSLTRGDVPHPRNATYVGWSRSAR
jgi:hypothetical protein